MVRFAEEYICYRNAPPVSDREAARAILWPVYVWQVSGPDTSVRRLNVFEKALLSLLSHGRGSDSTRIQALATQLDLEPDLVRYIIEQQLIPRNLVDDRRWELTKDGIKALSEQASVSDQLKTGYVFQDAAGSSASTAFFPRYSSTLEFVEPVDTWGGFPEFSFSKASNYKWRPLVIRPAVDSRAPDATDLRTIMDATSQAQRNARMMGADDDYDSFHQLDALALSDKEPFPAYIWVWLYADGATDYPWAVADPVGLHHDVEFMRNRLDEYSRSFPKLSREIGKVLGLDDTTDFEALERAIQSRGEQVRLEVIAEYPDASGVKGLADLLHGWMTRKQEVETSSADDRIHDYKDLITQSSGVLEFCASYCLKKYPLKNLRIIPRNCSNQDLQQLLSSTTDLTALQIDEVISVKPTSVYSTARNRKGSFRLCFAACFLAMKDYPGHPLRLFSRDMNCFFSAYELSHLRDKSAHADSDYKITKADAMNSAAVVDSFLKLFFEGLKRG